MDVVPAPVWIAACAHRLQCRWRTVDPGELESLAQALWADERLRRMDPEDAARTWLMPIEGSAARELPDR
jgi:hypothetical protein